MSFLEVKNPNKTENHMIINAPQNQCLLNLVLLKSISTNTPERKVKPENINDAIPKPRWIKTSLNQAPTLLSLFCVSTSLVVNSDKAL